MAYCKNCGTELTEIATRCLVCGQSVTKDSRAYLTFSRAVTHIKLVGLTSTFAIHFVNDDSVTIKGNIETLNISMDARTHHLRIETTIPELFDVYVNSSIEYVLI